MAKLSFKFIANACGVFTGSRGTQILCDPWLVDGVFDGSWCHYPKVKTTYADLASVDAVYVSHLHPDHFDERYFDFEKSKPLIVLDHGQNFLIKKLESLGYTNLVKIRDKETVKFREFDLTMFAPFATHNFHEAEIGNLIDSAILVSCDGVSALNANDNTLTVEAAREFRAKYDSPDLSMMNYNAAGPYPSCFDNLTIEEKRAEHGRILERNFSHLRDLLLALQPRYVLPFAGAYVLGGRLAHKNEYLGTTTWDECGQWLKNHGIGKTSVVLLREGDTLDVAAGTSDHPYVPIDAAEMKRYISEELARIKYPYENEGVPDKPCLVADVAVASGRMLRRLERIGIRSDFSVLLCVFGKQYQIYPAFSEAPGRPEKRLECEMDERLLRNILDRKSHWNNAEIGAHVSMKRIPNTYEPDLHTGLQFFHL